MFKNKQVKPCFPQQYLSGKLKKLEVIMKFSSVMYLIQTVDSNIFTAQQPGGLLNISYKHKTPVIVEQLLATNISNPARLA